MAKLKVANAFATLSAAASSDSPDDFLRNAALRAFGQLGDDKAVPLLVEWSAPGKPQETRQASISSLAQLDKSNHEITRRIAGYLNESTFPVRIASVFALGGRGDAEAIPALEGMLKSDDLSIAFAPFIEEQIQRLKKTGDREGTKDKAETKEGASVDQKVVLDRLEKLERVMTEMSERLKTIESRLAQSKN